MRAIYINLVFLYVVIDLRKRLLYRQENGKKVGMKVLDNAFHAEEFISAKYEFST